MSYKLLIVEDARLIAAHLKSILQKANYDIIGIASNTEQTMKVLNTTCPDLILMDIMLDDDEDGITLVEKINATVKFQIPVIYLTALSDSTTLERAKLTHPYGYIMKPFQEEQVITLVDMAINKHRDEVKLRQADRIFKAAVANITDAFFLLTGDFEIEYANPTALDLLDLQYDEVLGKVISHIIEFYDAESEKKLSKFWDCITDGPNLIHKVFFLNQKSKKVFVGDGSVVEIKGYKNEVEGFVVTFKDLTRRITEEKNKKQIEFQKLSSVIEGQEAERSRIARELHDGIGQALNALKLVVKNDSANQDELTGRIDEILVDVKRISENLIPAKLKDFDINTCIFSLIRSYTAPKITYQADDFDVTRINSQQKINVYRIIQEIITNVVKHADAKSLQIQIHSEGSNFKITAEDDGKGFEYNESLLLQPGHQGLNNITYRVNSMNGHLIIESGLGQGTLFIIELPYDQQKKYYEENIIG